tara:strand:+ start:1266 stop:1721 length:456 start_codon:yes stop_codon:yes gene_type:complete
MTELLKKFILKVWLWIGLPQPEPRVCFVEQPYEPPTFSDAYAALENWYWHVVCEYADEYADQREDSIKMFMEQEELDDEDEVDHCAVDEYMYEWLHELLDGCEEVIYTARSKAVLLASSNEDSYLEEFGEAPSDVHAAAFWALRTDIMERV